MLQNYRLILGKEDAAKFLRSVTPKGKREACYICGKHRGFTEHHHLLPISLMSNVLLASGVVADWSAVWLCPTHHRFIHSGQQENQFPFETELCELKEGELRAALDVMSATVELMDAAGELLVKTLVEARENEVSGNEEK